MKDRIKLVRQSYALTQAQFAEELGLSRNFVAMVEIGQREPSDRTIADICRVFNINEQWLRTGEGEMLVQLTPSEELAVFTAQLQREDSFRRRFVSALSTLDPEDWLVIEHFIDQLNEQKKTGQ